MLWSNKILSNKVTGVNITRPVQFMNKSQVLRNTSKVSFKTAFSLISVVSNLDYKMSFGDVEIKNNAQLSLLRPCYTCCMKCSFGQALCSYFSHSKKWFMQTSCWDKNHMCNQVLTNAPKICWNTSLPCLSPNNHYYLPPL